jgi:hypothetical protein
VELAGVAVDDHAEAVGARGHGDGGQTTGLFHGICLLGSMGVG